jgi:hypothetical protein
MISTVRQQSQKMVSKTASMIICFEPEAKLPAEILAESQPGFVT